MTLYATNIKWDTDGDKQLAKTLPKEISLAGVLNFYDGTDEENEIISDYITDYTGFCHYGFDVKIKK